MQVGYGQIAVQFAIDLRLAAKHASFVRKTVFLLLQVSVCPVKEIIEHFLKGYKFVLPCSCYYYSSCYCWILETSKLRLQVYKFVSRCLEEVILENRDTNLYPSVLRRCRDTNLYTRSGNQRTGIQICTHVAATSLAGPPTIIPVCLPGRHY